MRTTATVAAMFLLGLCASSHINAQDRTPLLTALQSSDFAVRRGAFYTLAGDTHGSDPQVNTAVIDLLASENAYLMTTTSGPIEYGEYYLDVVSYVAALKDARAIPSLMAAINTGNMVTDALASIGSATVAPALLRLSDNNNIVRYSVVSLFTKLLAPDIYNSLDGPAKEGIAFGLLAASSDGNLHVRSLASTALATAGSSTEITRIEIDVDVLRDHDRDDHGEERHTRHVETIDLHVDRLISVRILSSPTFAATTLDASTVRLGGGQAKPIHFRIQRRPRKQDDVVLVFRTHETGLTCGDSMTFLVGSTSTGQTVAGSDEVRVTGCGRDNKRSDRDHNGSGRK